MAITLSPSQRKDVNDIKGAANDMRNSATHAANEASHDLRDFAERAGTNVREFLYSKSEQADKIRKSAEETIVAHPLKSVAAAAIGGMLLNALLRRF